jgi:hypothetical protein
MDAYFVETKEFQTANFSLEGYTDYVPAELCAIVYAETRGRAKSLFFNYLKQEYPGDADFTLIVHCRIILKGTDKSEGVEGLPENPDDSPAWKLYAEDAGWLELWQAVWDETKAAVT